MRFSLLSWALFISVCYGLKNNVITTRFNISQVEEALLFFRSIYVFNWATLNSVSLRHNGPTLRACFDGAQDLLTYEIYSSFHNLGVQIVPQHHEVNYFTPKVSPDWRDLKCAGQLADQYFMKGFTEKSIVFISLKLYSVGGLTSLLESIPSAGPRTVSCWPKLPPFDGLLEQLAGVCEPDLLVIPSLIGTEFYSVLNTTGLLDVSSSASLDAAIRSSGAGLRFLTQKVIRAGRMWYNDDNADVSFVEFDGSDHRLSLSDCSVMLHVQWQQFGTVQGISDAFGPIIGDEFKSLQIGGCELEHIHGLAAALLPEDVSSGRPDEWLKPKVFDSFMFNDELSLLRLRLEFLKDSVDAHILIEAPQTFTGKPKPLYYLENKHLFADFEHKIVHVIMDNFTEEGLSSADQVWANEYRSRNMVGLALDSLGAADRDIIVLADIDELPHPRALQAIAALNAIDEDSETPNRRSHRIYKLYSQYFMYNFDCFVGDSGPFSFPSLTASSVGAARRLHPDPDNHVYITKTRMFMQSSRPYPFEIVLTPGGWHMSFFSNLDRIKRKLTSYSHQNFVRQFINTTCSTADSTAGVCDGAVAASPAYPLYDNLTGTEILPKELPSGEISTALIAAKIKEGLEIDNRNRRKCRRVHLDEDTQALKQLWLSLATEDDVFDGLNT